MQPSDGPRPPFITIRGLNAEADSGILRLSLSLGAAVPPGTPTVGILSYRFLLDLDDDGEWDRSASLEMRPGGGFAPVLLDRRTGERKEGSQYPGTANLAGAAISLTLALDALGCPSTLGMRAVAEQTLHSVTVSSSAPASGHWIRVTAGC